jgi:hypothetical protein
MRIILFLFIFISAFSSAQDNKTTQMDPYIQNKGKPSPVVRPEDKVKIIHGLDLFYEIPKAESVKNFQELLKDYENYSKQNLDFMVDAQNFNQFLVYGLFFTDIALKEKGNCTVLSHYLKTDYPTLYAFAEEQFRSKNPDQDNDMELQHYFGELYDLTKFYKGSVIKLHTT